MLRLSRSLVVSGAVVSAVMLAAPAGAQQAVGTASARHTAPAQTPPAVTVEAPATPVAVTPEVRGPALANLAAGFQPDAAQATAADQQGPQLPESGSRRKGAIFMIVGGAAMLGGAIVGDEAGAVIMIGGVLMTLYGLYTYLN